MKKICLLLLCLVGSLQGIAQDTPPILSDSATISVLTCGPGNEFYTSFGHSAIRVCDTAQGIDVVYNYGTFDFDTPHFYLTFARGRLNYCLSRTSFLNFMLEYSHDGRSVVSQELTLTQQEKQNLFVLLETNYLPQYRYYLYDFFRDNCATRIRDIVNSALCHRSMKTSVAFDERMTYRQLLNQYTSDNLMWWQFGVDFVLGMRCDHLCTPQERMFIPDEMMRQFGTATLSDTCLSLVSKTTFLLGDHHAMPSRSLSPSWVFWALFILVTLYTLLEWWKGWDCKWLDIVLFLAAGLCSLVIIFLWFLSNHYCTKYNWNLLWASPIFLYLAYLPRKKNIIAAFCQLGAFVAFIIVAILGVQHFNEAVFPIVLTLFVRTFNIIKRQNTSDAVE